MSSVPDHLAAAATSYIEAQIAVMANVTNQSFDVIEKIIELNMSLMRSLIDDSTSTLKESVSATHPGELFSSGHTTDHIEKALAYGRQLSAILSGAQGEFTEAAHAQIAQTNRKVMALVEQAGKNAPAGSENAVAMIKSAIDSANSSYEQFTNATKQAAVALEGNVYKAVNQFTQSRETGGTRGKKK